MPDLTSQIPAALQQNARWERIGDDRVPVMLVHPEWASDRAVPIVLWMHGRTVSKEIDPGRYLRLMRVPGGGIGSCAIDLPGHGERFDPGMQSPRQAWRVLRQMIEEIDPIVDALRDRYPFDLSRIGIGGMSLGGMAALARLTRPHAFAAASVEATTGSWAHQREREMFEPAAPDDVRRLEPIQNLDGWREIPLQAFHSRLDEWVAYEGQETFIEALRARYEDPSMVEFVVYDRTGAPNEHAGFGRKATDAKARQTDFFRRWLLAPDR